MTDDLSADDLAAASEAAAGARLPTDAELLAISQLAERVLAGERWITRLELKLKEAKELYKELTERDLPARLTALGMARFTLTDGTEIGLRPFSAVSIIKGSEPQALDWLRQNGGADIIKNTVAVEFGRGEDEDADQLAATLREQGMPVVQRTNVHFQTLNAWARVELSKGRGLDAQLFSVFAGQKAVIKQPKSAGEPR